MKKKEPMPLLLKVMIMCFTLGFNRDVDRFFELLNIVLDKKESE